MITTNEQGLIVNIEFPEKEPEKTVDVSGVTQQPKSQQAQNHLTDLQGRIVENVRALRELMGRDLITGEWIQDRVIPRPQQEPTERNAEPTLILLPCPLCDNFPMRYPTGRVSCISRGCDNYGVESPNEDRWNQAVRDYNEARTQEQEPEEDASYVGFD